MAPNPIIKETMVSSAPIAEAYVNGTAAEGPANGANQLPSVDLSAWAAENIPEFSAEYTAVKMEDLDTPEKLLAAQEKLLAYQEELIKYAESLK